MAAPSISLIIPAYNEESYISACLDSIINNPSNKFLEIMVVDNASTDQTAVIASAKPGVRVVREEEKGLTVARQRGLLEAKGEILAYVDADTRMPANWYQIVATEFANHPKVVCVSGPYFYYDISALQNWGVWLYWRIAIITYWLVGYMAVGGNFAIRKKTINQMGGFDTSISFYGEDTNLARRASQFGRVKFLPQLVMPTSGRRFAGQGFINTAGTYIANFFSEIFLRRPVTKSYKDLR